MINTLIIGFNLVKQNYFIIRALNETYLKYKIQRLNKII